MNVTVSIIKNILPNIQPDIKVLQDFYRLQNLRQYNQFTEVSLLKITGFHSHASEWLRYLSHRLGALRISFTAMNIIGILDIAKQHSRVR
jgi:hypothetical protein